MRLALIQKGVNFDSDTPTSELVDLSQRELRIRLVLFKRSRGTDDSRPTDEFCAHKDARLL